MPNKLHLLSGGSKILACFTKIVFNTAEYFFVPFLSNNVFWWFEWILLLLARIPTCLSYWLAWKSPLLTIGRVFDCGEGWFEK